MYPAVGSLTSKARTDPVAAAGSKTTHDTRQRQFQGLIHNTRMVAEPASDAVGMQ